ncbi:hypothetical protein FA13DRAFT_1424496 [Coprinellus micaceus]|uniref:Uncharacterized protein n=1 Tax=Coprinellus micaceus TaxID=71717 RepID=A0A4Y7TL80_COPMI|nr:hypothetical protein FA13DRAFT_1424496 [Coprinellus micaceus]
MRCRRSRAITNTAALRTRGLALDRPSNRLAAVTQGVHPGHPGHTKTYLPDSEKTSVGERCCTFGDEWGSELRCEATSLPTTTCDGYLCPLLRSSSGSPETNPNEQASFGRCTDTSPRFCLTRSVSTWRRSLRGNVHGPETGEARGPVTLVVNV